VSNREGIRSVSGDMRAILAVLLAVIVAGCGGGSASGPGPANTADPELDPTPVEEPQRTELQIRQEAACEAAGPRLTACAVEDTQAQTPEERAKADVEHTAEINTREFIKACTASVMSSRQVRVYEVCLAAETECEPLLACLDNAAPQQ
jgi:hypothetical protein